MTTCPIIDLPFAVLLHPTAPTSPPPSPDSSVDDISLFIITSTPTSHPLLCIYLEIVQTAPQKVPMMLAGEKMLTKDHWLDWATCCHMYFVNKESLKAEN
ncbi:uncharacterized protein ARMOST_12675 [Armillaria ostoyae]|uniref:Uncharacterized protein n=1 Tax=Armillaria ostoyae TaxID=47428 RepID=A0A284RKK8_ARMOS|nr:uncharacterized protein ARMOST_12675 [Armillaria ostoyae]